MFHLSHNYQFGVIVLILAFLSGFKNIPMVYAFFKIRERQGNQNK